MKCPYCGKEHDDSAKFCENTGKPIENQTLVCSNPDCNYRRPLPLQAKFCPACGRPLHQSTKKHSYPESNTSCIVLKEEYDRCRFIDANGNQLTNNSYRIVTQDCFDDDETVIQTCVFEYNSNAYYISSDGRFQKLGAFEDQDEAVMSSDGQFVLLTHNRSAILYKKDLEQGLMPVSQFRLIFNEISWFTVLGDYISLEHNKGFASVNFKTGEKLIIPGFKHSLIIAFRSNMPIIFAKNIYDDYVVVNKDGNTFDSFSPSPHSGYYPSEYHDYIIRWFNNKCGVVNTLGEEIIPPCFDGIEVQDEEHLILHLGTRYDWKRKKLEYNLNNNSFITKSWHDDKKILCQGEELPTSVDKLDEILKSYQFGFGDSSNLLVNDDHEIVRRVDHEVIYQMDDDEYPIGASDELKRFGVYNRHYLTIYDENGKLIKEFYFPKGIANPRLYANGVILFFNNNIDELCIISEDLNQSNVEIKSGGSSDVISNNCIAVDLPICGDIHIWKLYNALGESILPEEINVYLWKKLNEQYVILDTDNSETSNELGLGKKNGILLNLYDNSYVRIPFPYENGFILE